MGGTGFQIPNAPSEARTYRRKDFLAVEPANRRSPDFAINLLDHVIVGQPFNGSTGLFQLQPGISGVQQNRETVLIRVDRQLGELVQATCSRCYAF
jgi:hypothetical protein